MSLPHIRSLFCPIDRHLPPCPQSLVPLYIRLVYNHTAAPLARRPAKHLVDTCRRQTSIDSADISDTRSHPLDTTSAAVIRPISRLKTPLCFSAAIVRQLEYVPRIAVQSLSAHPSTQPRPPPKERTSQQAYREPSASIRHTSQILRIPTGGPSPCRQCKSPNPPCRRRRYPSARQARRQRPNRRRRRLFCRLPVQAQGTTSRRLGNKETNTINDFIYVNNHKHINNCNI